MTSTSSDVVHEIPLPAGVGIESTGPDSAQLVGNPVELHALALSIKARLGGPHPLPVLLDSSLVVQAEREAREWKRRFDDLLAAVTSGQLTTLGALAAAGAPTEPPEDRALTGILDVDLERRHLEAPTSPFEAGTGPCTMKGCTETGAHVHPGWMVARAAGKLTPEVASRWSAQQWIEFLRAHGLTQHQGVAEMRSWAETMWGQEPPTGLRSVHGRTDLARVLLDLADRTAAAAIEQSCEPW